MPADLGDIRAFIVQYFNDEELKTLCFDQFPEAFNDVAENASVNARAIHLIGYCNRRDLLPRLLVALKKERPEPYERAFGSRTSQAVRRVNVNTAEEADLTNLPGIGPALARAIIAGRPYHEVADLGRVPGIGPKRLAALRDWCDV